MPTKIPHPILFWIALATQPMVSNALEFLKAENELLRKQIDRPIRLDQADRDRLLKLGKPLGTGLRDLITIVTYTTFPQRRKANANIFGRTARCWTPFHSQ